jgi:hypothetical protein
MTEAKNNPTSTLVWQGDFQISELDTPSVNSKLPCQVSLTHTVETTTSAKLQVQWTSESATRIQLNDVWTLQLHCDWSYSAVSRNRDQYPQLLFIHNGISVTLTDSEYEQGKAAFSFGGLICSFEGLNASSTSDLRKLKQDANVSLLIFSNRL